jgi:hypothetical protein
MQYFGNDEIGVGRAGITRQACKVAAFARDGDGVGVRGEGSLDCGCGMKAGADSRSTTDNESSVRIGMTSMFVFRPECATRARNTIRVAGTAKSLAVADPGPHSAEA